MILYLLDLLGVAVFATSGALAALHLSTIFWGWRLPVFQLSAN
ncbi:MAG: hypothetical protein V4772_19865 [Pseudomonadota bacterium]